ncbi:site-specific recombinase, phage integrase family [Bacteroides pyogenes F0041]|uniref:Site-specific recombinase, phage integrase family n=2 Tax=Bacteria TaxID=2 RepID=U2CBB7_9BACE|nr:site-specific integrase [Bacteroides pyogenes]ERI81815.1 site-specific recombinase, phage integrase family [Bacteroides pyogenes F0041]
MEKNKSIREIAILWKEDKRKYVKISTYSAYVLILENHLLPVFGDMSEVEEEKVQNFILLKIQQGLSIKTVKDMLIVLKMIVKFGAKLGWITHKEWSLKYPTMQEGKTLEVLSIAHHKRILQYIGGHFTFRNLGIYICLTTGMRIGEICALTWNDIDMVNGVICVRRTIERIYSVDGNKRYTKVIIGLPKTRSSIRDIPMNRELIKMIRPLKKIVNGDFYVLTNEEKPTEPRTYRNYYKRLMEQLDIPPLKFHTSRHSFATRCIESNCDYKTVSVILGHSDIGTTLNLYVHPNMEQKKKCIDKMFKTVR